MAHIKITKGHDLKISGIPDKNIAYPAQYSTVAILPNDFRGVKPKLCLLYTSPSPRDQRGSRMPSSA